MSRKWESIKTDSTRLNLDAAQNAETASNISRCNETVNSRLKEVYCWLIVPSIDSGADMKTMAKELWHYQVMPWIGDMLISLSGNILTAIFNEVDYDDYPVSRSSGRTAYEDRYKKKKKKKGSRRTESHRSRDDDYDEVPDNLGPNEVHLLQFDSYAEAEEMTRWLVAQIRREGAVTAADLYSEKKIATTNFRCNRMGWNDEREIKRGRPYHGTDGYWHLKLPTPHELDDDDYYDNQE